MESKIFLRLALPQISVLRPARIYVEEVKEKSGESGDLHKLSEADISLIALALQFSKEEKGETIVVSEDYAIQNYCSIYGLKYKSLRRKEIDTKRRSLKQCKACKKNYSVKLTVCPNCGCEEFTIVKKSKKINKREA